LPAVTAASRPVLPSDEIANVSLPDATPMPRHLILFPTDLERRVALPLLGIGGSTGGHAGEPADERPTVALCGFGIAAAAARTALLVAELAPRRVILAGIAGRFAPVEQFAGRGPLGCCDEPLPLGSAACFDAVACHGIGVGSGAGFTAAAALGWPQWPGDPPAAEAAVGDMISCAIPAATDVPRAALLLTAAAASADDDDARVRRRLFPAAAAEDMEGFAVALACRLVGVPCTIVRGISNTVGDRDTARWQTTAALEAAAGIVRRLLAEDR
jgi:futalosine hydrolase